VDNEHPNKTLYRDSTRLIQAADNRHDYAGVSSVPIFNGSTFHQQDPLNLGHFDYSRSGNPTREALETALAELENGEVGLAFASGMAAICSVFMLFKPGDHLVVAEEVYGGTYRALSQLFHRWGLEVSWVNATDLQQVEDAFQQNTVAVYVETPSNPLLTITDLKAVADIAHARNALALTDNTFMSPWLQKPLDLGYDIVIHSATKFLGGHSDVLAGAAVTREKLWGKRLRQVQNTFGAVLGPQDSWLTLRGIRTLGVRMEQQQRSAAFLAGWLEDHPRIEKVFYPGLKKHTGYDIHMQQSSGGGAVLSFRLADQNAAKTVMESVHLPLVAVSLGGVESILSYPATMSHAAMPAGERQRRGITDGLLRLSVGLESPEDLQKDLEQALAKIC